jgi:hypothetical protein
MVLHSHGNEDLILHISLVAIQTHRSVRPSGVEEDNITLLLLITRSDTQSNSGMTPNPDRKIAIDLMKKGWTSEYFRIEPVYGSTYEVTGRFRAQHPALIGKRYQTKPSALSVIRARVRSVDVPMI